MRYKLGLEESQLLDSARFQEDLGIDSLDIVELQLEIEHKFQIKITDEEVEKMNTVESVIICVQRKMLSWFIWCAKDLFWLVIEFFSNMAFLIIISCVNGYYLIIVEAILLIQKAHQSAGFLA